MRRKSQAIDLPNKSVFPQNEQTENQEIESYYSRNRSKLSEQSVNSNVLNIPKNGGSNANNSPSMRSDK